MLVLASVVLALLLPFFAVPAAGGVAEASRDPPVGAPVKTTSGTVTGHCAKNATGVSEYLGIRYAQAANGTLRFQRPVAYTSSQHYAASSYSPTCPYAPSPPLPTFPDKYPQFDRIYETFTGQGGKSMSEDCLALNVWVKNPNPKRLKPVLFFIHGGRFATGTANITHYKGEYVADTEDAVVVSINYRISVLGFPGQPGGTLNLGLLDQRKALEWVRDNIKAFGGDPKKIMIYGQSVGGLSVDYHTYAWANDPIAAGAMSISGTAASVLPNTPELSAQYWYNLSSIVGCPATGDALPCMQSQTWQTLLAGITKLSFAPTKALFQPQFQETVDDVVVFSDYAARGKAGKFAKIPYLVGNTLNEAGFYKLAAFATKRNLTEDQWNSFNLQGFGCSSGIASNNRISNKITSYRYLYYGDFDNLKIYPGSGSYHGVDLNMWHGVGPDVSGLPNSAEENKLSKYMIKVLTTFAADPEDGLHKKLGWPKYQNSTDATLVQLGVDNLAKATFVSPRGYDSLCPGFDGDTSLAQGAM